MDREDLLGMLLFRVLIILRRSSYCTLLTLREVIVGTVEVAVAGRGPDLVELRREAVYVRERSDGSA
jgi:hypothetical protein